MFLMQDFKKESSYMYTIKKKIKTFKTILQMTGYHSQLWVALIH